MHRGMSTGTLVAIIAVVLVLGGALYYNTRPESEIMMNKGDQMMKDGQKMVDEGNQMMKDGEQMVKDGETMMNGENGDAMMTHDEAYQGSVLAQGKGGAILLDFTKADYDKAIASGKLVVLYFYANWCPDCKAEFPLFQAAINELDADVIGFRVNYNDSDTDNDEKALAKEYGVAYQHTKVFVKGDTRILKSPESWNTARYVSEINKAL